MLACNNCMATVRKAGLRVPPGEGESMHLPQSSPGLPRAFMAAAWPCRYWRRPPGEAWL